MAWNLSGLHVGGNRFAKVFFASSALLAGISLLTFFAPLLALGLLYALLAFAFALPLALGPAAFA